MFNEKDFLKTEFKARTEKVEVKELVEFFGKYKPEWVVRNMTAIENATVNEAVSQNKNMTDIMQALLSSQTDEKVEAMKEMLNLTDDVPSDIVRRYKILELASVKPECSFDMAKKIAETFPTVFF